MGCILEIHNTSTVADFTKAAGDFFSSGFLLDSGCILSQSYIHLLPGTYQVPIYFFHIPSVLIIFFVCHANIIVLVIMLCRFYKEKLIQLFFKIFWRIELLDIVDTFGRNVSLVDMMIHLLVVKQYNCKEPLPVYLEEGASCQF